MPMDHRLKERWVARTRSGNYGVTQYHLAQVSFGKIKRWTPLAILVEEAGAEFDWRPCELPDHNAHDAMYVMGDYETLTPALLDALGLTAETHELAGFLTLPDEVLELVGLTREDCEALRKMADGAYKDGKRIFPATTNQMADWIHVHVEADQPDDPSNEIGPAPDWQQLPVSAVLGQEDAQHGHFSRSPGGERKPTPEHSA